MDLEAAVTWVTGYAREAQGTLSQQESRGHTVPIAPAPPCPSGQVPGHFPCRCGRVPESHSEMKE